MGEAERLLLSRAWDVLSDPECDQEKPVPSEGPEVAPAGAPKGGDRDFQEGVAHPCACLKGSLLQCGEWTGWGPAAGGLVGRTRRAQCLESLCSPLNSKLHEI